MEPFERSTIQLMSILVRNEEKDTISSLDTVPKLTQPFNVKSTSLSMQNTSTF